MSHNFGVLLLKLSRVLWCTAAILVPLVMFPWTSDQFDFNKAFVLIVLGTGITATAFFGLALTKSLQLKMHPVLLLPAVFLFVAALSSFFSIDQAASFLGDGGQEHASLLMGIFLYVLLLVGSVFLEDEGLRKSLSSSMLVGSAVVGGISMLTFLGLSVPPFQNTVGVPSALAVYLLVITFFGTAWFLASADQASSAKSWTARSGFGLTAIFTAFLLVVFDAVLLWMLTVISVLILFAFVFARPELLKKTWILAIPGLFLSLAVVFLFIPSPLHGKFPLEVSLNHKASLGVVEQTLAVHPLIGSGPGTFVLDYSQYAPLALNSSLFWDTRFSVAMSEFFTMLATHGVFGLLAFALFPTALLFYGLRAMVSVKADWQQVLPPFMAYIVLLFAFFLFSFTITTVFFMTVFGAWLAALALPPSRSVSHGHSPRLALLSSFGALLASVGILVALFVSFTRYGAELAFAKAVAWDREGRSPAEIIRLLNRAATLNTRNDNYYRNLASALLMQTSATATDPKADPTAIQSYLAATINSAMAATKVGPNDVNNWQMLCVVYREFSSVVEGANDHAVNACLKATELAPKNPKYLVDLARVYIVRVDLLNPLVSGDDEAVATKARDAQAEFLNRASEALGKAIELKSDYPAARYYLAFVAERKGDLAGAVQNMEVARAINPKDVGVSIQLSLLYLRQGKNDLAATELERAQALDPRNENVLWYLSVAYEAQGKKSEAISLVEELLKTNSDKETVKARLEKLKTSGTAPAPVIPEPIESTPPVEGEGLPVAPIVTP